jgi:hypothetical protein
VLRGAGGVVGPGLDRGAAPGSGLSAVRAGNMRRARVADRKQRGGTDRWAATQCRAAVPLTGGSGLLAGAGQSEARCVDARAHVGRPEKERRWAAQMSSMVLYLFELV